jgi:SnoaL-like domain
MALPDTAVDPVQTALARIARFFETLQPGSVAQISAHYTPDAYFKDPFNEVRGCDAIEKIFAHMFTALGQPRFIVTGSVCQNSEIFLTWNFEFYLLRIKPDMLQTIRGASHLKLDSQQQIFFHRDYWDAAEELYEKLPVVGGVMRWLKGRVNG